MKLTEHQKYKDLTYSLTRSDRKKTFSIYIERNGAVSVISPENASLKEVERLLEKKQRWIFRTLAKWEDLNSTRKIREIVSGESFLYLGEPFTLEIVTTQAEALKFDDHKFYLKASQRSKAKAHFMEFYRERGKEVIPKRVNLYRQSMDVHPGRIRIVELQNRWASCTRQGNLNFHWKCLMAPIKTLDYIIVHELVHLLHPNHSPQFWNEVDKVMPDFHARKAWLTQHGASMDL